MGVTNDTIWITYLGSVLLILALYGAKAIILLKVPRWQPALLLFACLVVAASPATWALSPDWNNMHVRRIAIYLGSPIITFGVPCFSFIVDVMRSDQIKCQEWCWRIPVELLVAVPLWFFFWIFFELMVLGWVWI
jgi:hypothetical protein